MFNGALSSVGAQGYSSLVAPISIIANLQNNTSHTKDSVRIFKGLNYIGLGNIFICFLNICIKKNHVTLQLGVPYLGAQGPLGPCSPSLGRLRP